jgi:hypothetical protein
MVLARDAGLRTVQLSAVWTPPLTEPPHDELAALRTTARAARAAGIRPIVAVYQFSGSTPATPEARREFVAFAASIVRAIPEVRDVVVGNEPNLNLFWVPQFDRDGSDAAAPAYLELLAEAYDALKDVDADVTVIGGALAPRGGDDPTAARQTHSPTAFLRDLGAAYRASGRRRPVMDALSIHTYGDNSLEPPTLAHPRTTTIGLADYDKLVRLLGQAFDGTGQRGSSLPIVYGEYGVETLVPPGHRAAYTGQEFPSTHPVPAGLQGLRYAEAVHLAACQPNVTMLLLFHVADEPRLEGWQSGVYWADGAPKPSLAPVRDAAEHPSCDR